MDIEKLIEAVKLCGSTPKVDQCKKCTHWAGGDMSKCIPRMTEDAATALSTLQAENEKLRAEVESLKKEHCAGCSVPVVEAERLRDLNEAPNLRAELEQVKRERDAAQVTLAETSGLAGGVVQTLFGVPLERMRELAKAELEGRIVLRSAGAGKKCGSCGNFHRIPGTKRGTCAIRQWELIRLGQTEHWRHSFTPSQSYGACRDYIPREDDNHG